jgi:hypothetical protein
MNTLSRAAFFALDPIAQASHCRSGGTVIDDPPVRGKYDDIPYIADGRARLAAFQARDEQLKRMANDEAALDAELAAAKATLARWQAER